MDDSAPSDGVGRRQFLKVLGVTGAGTAALTGCSTDRIQKLVPYMVQSEQQVPGIPTVYASTCTECSVGCGIHVVTREARAIKLEGNPDHPINAGSICSRGQAALQGLYNPDRLGTPLARNAAGGFDEITWDDAIARLSAQLASAGSRVAAINGYGAGTFSDLLDSVVGGAGGQVIRWEPFGREAERLAAEATFGRSDLPVYDFAAADFIVSFGADFLDTWGITPANERGYAASHGFHDGRMSKHVYVGPRMNLTAANADEWLSVPAGTEIDVALCFARAAAERRGSPLAGSLSAHTVAAVAAKTGLDAARLGHLVDEFAGASAPLAAAGGIGSQTTAAVELVRAAYLCNAAAGSIGTTVRFGAAPAGTVGYGAVRELFDRMGRGDFAVVLVHEANPLYALPKQGGFADAFAKVAFKVSTSNMLDETAAACDLILPNLHSLERWDDVRSSGHVTGLMQPVMQPVRPGMHTGDVLLRVRKAAGATVPDSFEIHLREIWTGEAGRRGRSGDAAAFWRESLAKGGTYDAEPAAAAVAVANAAVAPGDIALDGDGEFVFLPYPSKMYHDGRGANKPWLLENSDPLTKITWQSWAEIHPRTAERLDVRDGEIVELISPHGSIQAQVYVWAGVREDTIAMPLGLGHTEYGRYAKGRGVNALDLLGAGNAGAGFLPYVATRVSVRRTGKYRQLAKTDGNPRQLGRHIIETMPLAHAAQGMTPEESYKAISGHGAHAINTPQELEAIDGWYDVQRERWKIGDYADDATPRWGMVVDLSRCTGCSACVTACYAENNIPTVGEEQIFRGREMTWVRIERYWEGDEDGGQLEARFAPMMCQHCDNAPCEPVCPVYAAYHTPDGLNGQVYNRCVGTRYCSNNCPFKVRYYNWLKYNEFAWPEPLNLQLNPEVTVRARGVMEKCTFCVQRIRGAQHHAALEGRTVRDGEVQPACAQACASGAMTFGNVKDPDARVSQAMRNPRGYRMLELTNVRPAITYLAKVLNREPEVSEHGGGH